MTTTQIVLILAALILAGLFISVEWVRRVDYRRALRRAHERHVVEVDAIFPGAVGDLKAAREAAAERRRQFRERQTS